MIVYTEDFHIETKKLNNGIKELYYSLRERILNLGEVNIVPRQQYIGFKRRTNFVDIGFQKSNLFLWINLKKGKLDDPKGLTRDISGSPGFGNGEYDLKVSLETDIDYVMFLINQSYKNQD